MRVLQQLPEFQTYQDVCRSHNVVGKNDLAALLIAPMQHQCRYQLKLDVCEQFILHSVCSQWLSHWNHKITSLSLSLSIPLQMHVQQVLKYTQVPAEKELLSSTIKAFVVSLSESYQVKCNIFIVFVNHRGAGSQHQWAQTLSWAIRTPRNSTLAFSVPTKSRSLC